MHGKNLEMTKNLHKNPTVKWLSLIWSGNCSNFLSSKLLMTKLQNKVNLNFVEWIITAWYDKAFMMHETWYLIHLFNQFRVNFLFLFPMKTSENRCLQLYQKINSNTDVFLRILRFKNTFTTEHLPGTFSVFWKKSFEMIYIYLEIQCPIIKTWLMIWFGTFPSYKISQ